MPVARRMAAWSMRWLISSWVALRVRGSPGPLRPGLTIAAGSAGAAGASEAGRRGAGDAGPQLGRADRVAAQVAGLQAAVEAGLDGVETPDGGLADALVDAQLGDA